MDGAYFWQCVSGDEVVGAEADGLMADRFRGTSVRAGESAVAIAIEAIRQRKTIYENRLNPAAYRMAAEFQALSLMAAPLVVGNEVIGAATFLHCSDPDFFNEDLAAKATILAGQLGSLLEARDSPKFPARSIGVVKFWPRWHRLSGPRRNRQRWWRRSPTG